MQHKKDLSRREEDEEDDGTDIRAASVVATTFVESDTPDPTTVLDDQVKQADHSTASVYTAATSFFNREDGENSGREIPDLLALVLDGQQLEYGKHFECPYCRTIQLVHNNYEWRYDVLLQTRYQN